MIQVLIVDDEELAREGMRMHLARHPDVEVLGESSSGREAVEAIERLKPDLVFLDVQMPGLDGFDVIQAVGEESMPAVIFVTAHQAPAVQAFEASALDYVLKPFDRERFDRALERARYRLETERLEAWAHNLNSMLAGADKEGKAASSPSSGTPGPFAERFLASRARRKHVVPVAKIDWVEASGDYVKVHVQDGSFLLRMTLVDMEERLNPEQFVRIHRSTIINLDRVKELQPYSNREYIVIMRDGTKLKLSRSYRDRFDAHFGEDS